MNSAVMIGLLIGMCALWGACGFALGYKIALRRRPIRFIHTAVSPVAMGNTVRPTAPGPGTDRAWRDPDWVD